MVHVAKTKRLSLLSASAESPARGHLFAKCLASNLRQGQQRLGQERFQEISPTSVCLRRVSLSPVPVLARTNRPKHTGATRERGHALPQAPPACPFLGQPGGTRFSNRHMATVSPQVAKSQI